MVVTSWRTLPASVNLHRPQTIPTLAASATSQGRSETIMAKKSSAAPASSNELGEQPTEAATVPRDLESQREFWQTTAPYDPARPLDSRQTRFEQGKALREQTPRKSHAAWTPPADRADPVATVLASNVGREESLIPLRMGRMAESPFAFLRGACMVMAGDLARLHPTVGVVCGHGAVGACGY